MPRPGRHSQGGVPEFAAWLAVGPADGDPSALSWLGPALLLLSRLSLLCPSSGAFATHGFSLRDRQAKDRNGNYQTAPIMLLKMQSKTRLIQEAQGVGDPGMPLLLRVLIVDVRAGADLGECETF